jgi:hypothetical protein
VTVFFVPIQYMFKQSKVGYWKVKLITQDSLVSPSHGFTVGPICMQGVTVARDNRVYPRNEGKA